MHHHRARSNHLESPVSGVMRRSLVTLRDEQTVAEAVAALKQKEINDQIVYLYVVSAEDRLVGVVPVRRLLTSDAQTRLSEIMIRQVRSIPSTAPLHTAYEGLLEHRLLALPVVDAEHRLVGVVDATSLTGSTVRSFRQAEIAGVFQLIGVHMVLGRRESPFRAFLSRFPWLLCNIASGVLCAFIAGFNELLISEFTILALFLTVVLALSESISIQSMTLTLQLLMREKLSWLRALAAVRREVLAALLLGAAAGILVGGVAVCWRGDWRAGLAIATSIALAMVTASLLGVVIPMTVRALRADPKVAAGPVVLALADMATLVFYFSIASWLLRG